MALRFEPRSALLAFHLVDLDDSSLSGCPSGDHAVTLVLLRALRPALNPAKSIANVVAPSAVIPSNALDSPDNR